MKYQQKYEVYRMKQKLQIQFFKPTKISANPIPFDLDLLLIILYFHIIQSLKDNLKMIIIFFPTFKTNKEQPLLHEIQNNLSIQFLKPEVLQIYPRKQVFKSSVTNQINYLKFYRKFVFQIFLNRSFSPIFLKPIPLHVSRIPPLKS
ncbi:hypothetical protein TTHERM_000564499 (macronuclear) [Tetrahymena thermophila SB210]|uniref:Uncharacterized protein n=1 Tax=Tetrahymena thermophila (strain SB210) TaxID=312017 RepID=W7X606_TETTS|nr:hypothetical protein TTHERM_000564499 [Tetrahymena thermophila SB210]EWS72817.1 hypothetical protein TTHERM_000564499 [Tetrahymena thermophila SB210]|eukprot:XP_012654643.1 hypothetical protein TTHERM_000564499 [Tetrahymena thermophila SB210]